MQRLPWWLSKHCIRLKIWIEIEILVLVGHTVLAGHHLISCAAVSPLQTRGHSFESPSTAGYPTQVMAVCNTLQPELTHSVLSLLPKTVTGATENTTARIESHISGFVSNSRRIDLLRTVLRILVFPSHNSPAEIENRRNGSRTAVKSWLPRLSRRTEPLRTTWAPSHRSVLVPRQQNSYLRHWKTRR